MNQDISTKEYITIGEAIELLQDKWPEISHSTIRYWEKEGLIHLHRTEGGHRVFCRTDLERLHQIAELRQRRYLPLSAVKRILKEIDSDPTYDLNLLDEIFRPEEYEPDFQPLDAHELARQSELTINQLEEFIVSGLFPEWDESGEGNFYDEDDLKIAQLIGELVKQGFKPSDLAFYAVDMREHVNHELQLFGKVLRLCTGEPERHAVYRQVQSITRNLRSFLYRKYGRQAIVKLLEDG